MGNLLCEIKFINLYIFTVINIYRKSREPTPGYLVFDSWGISWGKMTHSGATREIFSVSYGIAITLLKPIAHVA